tara:strand:+ start:571 stop:1830 length:1260 start_codon:yes stop_codon:yes gene_type:complete
MNREKNTYKENDKTVVSLFNDNELTSEFVKDSYDFEFDKAMNNIDFSEIRGGDFKKSFSNLKNKMNQTKLSGIVVPDSRDVIIEGRGSSSDSEETILGRDARKIIERKPSRVERRAVEAAKKSGPRRSETDGETRLSGVVVGNDREVIIEGRGAEPDEFVEDVPKLRPDKIVDELDTYTTREVDGIPIEEKTTATLEGREGKKIKDIIVPGDREVVVKGVSDFIISQGNSEIKNIGYYKGKKLKELVLTFNNNSGVDFELAIFDPSAPLDYLFSTSLNLNNQIEVSGGAGTSYSDVLFNILGNPTFIPNCQFIFTGPNISQQRNEVLKSQIKSVDGFNYIEPLNLDLQVDTFQVAGDIVYFDISNKMNRPFIPDGMDVLNYKVLKGNSVTMCFYYQQISLKKYFFPEARNPIKQLPNEA